MRVIVCGGGVIGACLAYYLGRDGADVLLVERHRIAGAASGKSGGFLALDWCDGSALSPLARRSFQLHQELADAHGNPWGYRRLDTYAAQARGARSPASSSALPWLEAGVRVQGQLGSAETTAQITPAAFTKGMVEEAVALGATCLQGRVTGLLLDPGGSRVVGVDVEGRREEADAVVIAMGPWSTLARQWLTIPEVYGLKGHSVVLRPVRPVPAEALFVEIDDGAGESDTPEVFPRPDGTVYLCGLSDYASLPVDPAAVTTHADATARLQAMAGKLSPCLEGAEVIEAGACYRPVTQDGLPLMGAIPDVEGAYVATGHNVWGMLNAPASGEAMAGLILDGRSGEVDLAAFDPGRFSV